MHRENAKLNIHAASDVTLEAMKANQVNVKMLAGTLRILLGKTVENHFCQNMSKEALWMSGHTKHNESTFYHHDGIANLTIEGADTILVDVKAVSDEIYKRIAVLDGTPIEQIVRENIEDGVLYIPTSGSKIVH